MRFTPDIFLENGLQSRQEEFFTLNLAIKKHFGSPKQKQKDVLEIP